MAVGLCTIEKMSWVRSNDSMVIFLLKAMPEPSPAKTKISIEKNSANAALIASGWLASPGAPIAILVIGIFYKLKVSALELESSLFCVLFSNYLGCL